MIFQNRPTDLMEWCVRIGATNKFKLFKAPVSLQSRFMNDLSTAIPPDTACCGSFLLDSQGEFLYSPSPKKQVLITITSKGV